MRKSDREVKDAAKAEALLLRAQYVQVAMLDGGEPYVVPVNFGYESGALYFHGAVAGRKAGCLRAGARVAFSAVAQYRLITHAQACGYTAHYASVAGWGQAVVLEDEAEKRRALGIIMRHYGGPDGPWETAVLARTMVVRVDVRELTGKVNPPSALAEL